jgi:phenylpyruvate tautomerase PptA (4-oxalocrotonate tautomerase family)
MGRITKEAQTEKLIADITSLDIKTLNLTQLSALVEAVNEIKTSANILIGSIAREIIKES